MSKRLMLSYILLLIYYGSFCQGVGIGTATPDASAALDITATNKGLLIPRMNTASINAIVNPARGLMVYDSVTNKLMANMGTPVTPNWQPVASGSSSGGWSLTGNGGIDPANQFIGNIDNQPLRFRVNNIQAGEIHPVSGNISLGLRANQLNEAGYSNIAIGTDALRSNTAGVNLVAIGDSALFNNINTGPTSNDPTSGINNTAVGSKSLFSNTIGNSNTATGSGTLYSNTTGNGNTASGVASLHQNTTGNFNTGIGNGSLGANTTGFFNTAAGWHSLHSNTTAGNNTAYGSLSLERNTTGTGNVGIGFAALNFNSTGDGNTAVGEHSLLNNTTGDGNTATGAQSLISNTTGRFNTAAGHHSLITNTIGESNTAYGSFSLNGNTTGIGNTATGSGSLFSNTTGSVNTAIGDLSLNANTTGNNNTATGVQSLFLNTTGNFNTAVGGNALGATFSGSNNTVVGFNAAFVFNLGSDNTIIGAGADAGADGATNCVAIGKDAKCTGNNQVRLGNTFTTSIGGVVGFTNLSDFRFKQNIREAVKGIDFIMKLRPVTYQLDVAGISSRLNESNGGEMNALSKKGIDENGKTIFSGFVAQEVEQAAKAAGYDFSGVDKPKNENDMYGLRYAEFVVPLVKAMQEQQQMIEELKKINADLVKRMEKLESSLHLRK